MKEFEMKMKKGFSLIEIGIVMIVVGILIAAVMKGKDVINSAEIKQHNQTFLNKWVSVATTHYDKLGYNITGTSDAGSMTVGQGIGDDTNVTGVYNCDQIITSIEQAGINVNNVISTNTNSPCRKSISGEFTGAVIVSIGFENVIIETKEEANTTKNLVLFYNVPGDIALSFDRLVDGKADTFSGKIVVLDDYATALVDTNITDDNITNVANIKAISTSSVLPTRLHTVGVILEH